MLKQIDSSETTAGGSGWWVEAEANRPRHDWRMRCRTDQRRPPKKKEWASASGQERTAAELPGIARTPLLSALSPPAYAGFPTNLLPLRPTVARLANTGHYLRGGVASAPPIPLTQLISRALVEEHGTLAARADAVMECFVGLEAVSERIGADHLGDCVNHKIGGVLLETEPLCSVTGVASGRAHEGTIDGLGDPEIASAILGHVPDRITGNRDRDGKARTRRQHEGQRMDVDGACRRAVPIRSRLAGYVRWQWVRVRHGRREHEERCGYR